MTSITLRPALEMDNVTVRLGGRDVLARLSLAVEPGESLSIQGRSGSGKSTLLATVLGLTKPSSGTVRVHGEDPHQMKRGQLARFRSRNIGMVFQHAELVESMTALENVALPAMLSDTGRSDALIRAAELLEAVQVPDRPTIAADLSGGERQRTALARALINNPPLILADEPTGALDTELRDSAAQLLFDLPDRTGIALVVVTHDPAIADHAATRARLIDGELHSASRV